MKQEGHKFLKEHVINSGLKCGLFSCKCMYSAYVLKIICVLKILLTIDSDNSNFQDNSK